jgi:hypothetical protein
MIATDTVLPISITDQRAKSLAQQCAEHFSHFVRTQFNPDSLESWVIADKLWRVALLARDAQRGAQ